MRNLIDLTDHCVLRGSCYFDGASWACFDVRAGGGDRFQNRDLGLRLARRVLCLRAP